MAMRHPDRDKMVVFWEYDAVDSQPHVQRQTCAKGLSKITIYSLIAAGSLVVCGIIATLWVWTRYGGDGFRFGESSVTAAVLLGPILCLIGVVCIFTACIVHEVKERRIYDPLEPIDFV